MKNSKLNTLLREPLLHFLLIGAALFFIYDMQNINVSDNNRIVISEGKINHLVTLWEKSRQRPPTPGELNAMIEQQIREEVMYREALAMGLDKNDSIVRRRLAQKVEFIFADLAALIEPDETQLADYLATHSEHFKQPTRLSFMQVFVSHDKHADQTQNYARNLLKKLQTDSTIDITKIGDSLMLDQQYEQQTQHSISRIFGEDFASNLFTYPADNWQGPVLSGYGLHLVYIYNKSKGMPPILSEVREKVRTEWFAQQRRKMDKTFYESLRQRYDVVVDEININATTDNEKLLRSGTANLEE